MIPINMLTSRQQILLHLPSSDFSSARLAFHALYTTILDSQVLQTRLLAPLALAFSPRFWPHRARILPGEYAVDAVWSIPDVSEESHWTAPRIKVIPAEDLTIVEISLRFTPDTEPEMDLGPQGVGFLEFLVWPPPTSRMQLKMDLSLYEIDELREAEELAQVYSTIGMKTCPVKALMEIANAGWKAFEACWPWGEVKTSYKEWKSGAARFVLEWFELRPSVSAFVDGGMKAIVAAKVAIPAPESEDDDDDEEED